MVSGLKTSVAVCCCQVSRFRFLYPFCLKLSARVFSVWNVCSWSQKFDVWVICKVHINDGAKVIESHKQRSEYTEWNTKSSDVNRCTETVRLFVLCESTSSYNLRKQEFEIQKLYKYNNYLRLVYFLTNKNITYIYYIMKITV